jgi:hypothetical protein
MKMNYQKKYAQTVEVNEDVADQSQDGLTEWKKTQVSWALDIG